MVAVLNPLKLSAAVSSDVYGENRAIVRNTSGYPVEPKKPVNLACNCVLWAQQQGLSISGYGSAKNYPINSKIPAFYGFVVTYEGWAGHIAMYYLDGGDLVLDEANYAHCAVTSGRRLPVNSSLIKGYINAVPAM